MSGLYAVSWPEHDKERTSAVKDMLERNAFVDVTLACDDDQIQAHKVLLSAASPFFLKVLERNSHAHPLLYLRGAQKKDVSAILNFIYEGETSVPARDFDSFMSLAKDLEVKGLIDETKKKSTESTETQSKAEHIESENKTKAKRKRKKQMPKQQEKNEKAEEGDVEDIKPNIEDLRSNLDMEVEEVELEQHLEQMMTVDTPENSNKSYKKEVTVSAETPDFEDSNNSEVVDDVSPLANIQEAVKNEKHHEYANDEMKAKVDALIVTTPDGFFVCNECRYGSKSEEHVREHIELHIEGFSHKCRTCNRVFTKRTSFKFHMSKCQKK